MPKGAITRGARAAVAAVLLPVVCLVAWLVARPAHAGDPDQRWRTLETEHFYVHYVVGEEDAAERVAATAERAYDRLTVAWGHEVFLKIHVSLYDNQDTANGRATAVPFPQIVAYTTAPEALSVLESYDDWIDILITHELVHVVHLDTVHGIPRLVNAIFGFGVLGKVTAPNILQPRWMVEGIATMNESDYSSFGRRRSAQFDAFIRMAVLEGGFQTLDQVSSGARVWPHGTSVYLYGVHFMYYIAARYGPDKLRELSHVYARQLVPFGINRAVQDVLGVDFQQLWKEFQQDTTRRFQAQARRIRSRGLRQGRRLTFSGEGTRYPFWAPDDRHVYFYESSGHREEGIKRIAADGGRMREGRGIGRQGVDVDVEHVLDVEDSASAGFVGATGDMVFDWTNAYDFRYRWSDLYRWNGGDPEEAEQLTFGLRASEPHVSPDGRRVAFRRNDVAQSRLGLLDLATGDVTEVAPTGRIDQVYTPRWSPDGRTIAFSGWREGGYRDIYLHDLGSGRTRRITADRHVDISPAWTPDGRYLLFSSDRDDVFNLYAWDAEDGSLHQVSNVLGGAFEPRVSHDGTRIAYVGYSKSGYDLWVMELDPTKWLEPMPSVSDLPEVDDNKPPLRGQTRPLTLGSRRYQPWRTMFPRSVFPTALDVATSQFGTALGASTGVADVLGFHAATASVLYLFQQRVLTGEVAYAYDRLLPNFRVAAGRGYSERRGFTRYEYQREPGDPDTYTQTGYRERNTYAEAAVGVPVVRTARHSADAGISYRFTRLRNLDAADAPIDPGAPTTQLPEVGDIGQVTLRGSYSSLGDGSGRFTTGSERGRSAAVALSVLDERLGGDFGDLQVTGSYREVIPMPWRGHQSLELSVRGGTSAGGLRRRGAFCVGDFGSGPGVLGGADVVLSALNRTGFGANGCSLLRGYGPSAANGQSFAIGSASYRIPLVDVDRGLGTAPFFFQRVTMVPFVDWGAAWTTRIPVRDALLGAGATLAFTFRLGFIESVSVLLQYAHGFEREHGLDTFRVLVGNAF